ncbi:MAG TPA: TerC family protein [Syntrophales bacterium]|nr:TerC family protein [Syntrophales bacterium]
MSLDLLGHISFSWEFVTAFLSIVLIDLILAGDNAVVIAMAVRSLPRKQRLKGIMVGAAAAVVLRVIITFFAAKLLLMGYVKLIGGALILWVAVKLFVEGVPEEEGQREAKTLWQAMWIIVVADLTMSLDNILAVAGASKGNPFLLAFGLGLSIPFVVFTSNLLSMLMDKYPVIIYLGAAILGKVGAEMIFTDPVITEAFAPSVVFQYAMEALFAVGVIAVGKLWVRWQISSKNKSA